jgi:acetyl esterase
MQFDQCAPLTIAIALHAKPLSKPMMEWFVKQVFETQSDTDDSRINLVKANLSGLPSATIVLAEIDPLRSGEELAKCLKEAGRKVDYKVYGSVHTNSLEWA